MGRVLAGQDRRGRRVRPFINEIPKLVASTTLSSVEWRNSSLISGDLGEELREVKGRPGKNILVQGSATLIRSLLREGLLDELRLLVFPVAMGSGQRLFEGWTDKTDLELVEARPLPTGVVSLVYRGPVR